MVRYAVAVVVFIAVILGAYRVGYLRGSDNAKIEYVTKEVEVVRYVGEKKEKIYVRPNDNFIAIYKRMREQR